MKEQSRRILFRSSLQHTRQQGGGEIARAREQKFGCFLCVVVRIAIEHLCAYEVYLVGTLLIESIHTNANRNCVDQTCDAHRNCTVFSTGFFFFLKTPPQLCKEIEDFFRRNSHFQALCTHSNRALPMGYFLALRAVPDT